MSQRNKNGQLIAGVIILGLGILLALQYVLDFRIYNLYRLWPLIVIALGVARLVGAEDRRQRGSALVLTSVGVWMLVNTLELFGLDWGDSWPLLLILIGGAKLIAPDCGRRSSGLLMLLIGVWASLNVFELWGLYWENSWSIALIIVGLFIVWKALFERQDDATPEGD